MKIYEEFPDRSKWKYTSSRILLFFCIEASPPRKTSKYWKSPSSRRFLDIFSCRIWISSWKLSEFTRYGRAGSFHVVRHFRFEQNSFLAELHPIAHLIVTKWTFPVNLCFIFTECAMKRQIFAPQDFFMAIFVFSTLFSMGNRPISKEILKIMVLLGYLLFMIA